METYKLSWCSAACIGGAAAAATAAAAGCFAAGCALPPPLCQRGSPSDAAKAGCSLDKDKNLLLVLPCRAGEGSTKPSAEALRAEFFGTVVTLTFGAGSLDAKVLAAKVTSKTVYVCGDLSLLDSVATALSRAERVFVVIPDSESEAETTRRLPTRKESAYEVVGEGRVPRDIHGVGVLFPRYFSANTEYFRRITEEHQFQNLTESNKPGTAHRTGIYLTDVEECPGEGTKFKLLRCSSNFSGPTLGFAPSDREIMAAINLEAKALFHNPAQLNHVLAQVYHNTAKTATTKATKAKIKAHADKTKDMPPNGLMAFVTFYDGLEKLIQNPAAPFDWGIKNNSGRVKSSGLTRLMFKLKAGVTASRQLVSNFEVTLSPESVFFMPLSTNRLYTHEIRPSTLDPEFLPTRLGYVVRCSETEAIWRDGATHIKRHAQLIRLEEPTPAGVKALRDLYWMENTSDAKVDYKPFLFSLNKGDYMQPLAFNHMAGAGRVEPAHEQPAEAFASFELEPDDNLFATLASSVSLEDFAKGRQGTIVVRPDEARGNPIVRMCDKYYSPAPRFPPAVGRLADQIGQQISHQTTFNNAIIECYNNEYFRMGFHSDLALDLDDDAPIAIYSCYEDPSLPPRMLVVESKLTKQKQEIPLKHNSVVVWSSETNRQYRHKIVLDVSQQPPPNRWLGITFRTSKTFVKVVDGCAQLEDGTRLTLANQTESKEFYALRSRENKETDFEWPVLSFTVSPQDMLECASK